jgi:hypothetical protein
MTTDSKLSEGFIPVVITDPPPDPVRFDSNKRSVSSRDCGEWVNNGSGLEKPMLNIWPKIRVPKGIFDEILVFIATGRVISYFKRTVSTCVRWQRLTTEDGLPDLLLQSLNSN